MLPSCSLSCNIRKFVRPLLVKKYFSLISVKQNKINMKKFRSSCPEVFCKKGVLNNFAKSSGSFNMKKLQKQPLEVFCKKKLFLEISPNSQKAPVPGLFLIKLRAKAEKRFKKETLAQVFSCEFCEISNNTLFTEHLRATGSNVYRSFWEPLVYSTALVVVSVLASCLQWPETLSVKEHFCY